MMLPDVLLTFVRTQRISSFGCQFDALWCVITVSPDRNLGRNDCNRAILRDHRNVLHMKPSGELDKTPKLVTTILMWMASLSAQLGSSSSERETSRNDWSYTILFGLPQRLVHETFGWIGQDTEDGYDLSCVGGFAVGSAWIEFFGTRNKQKRLEQHDPSGSPQCLVHETFGWIGQDIENGYDLSYVVVGDCVVGSAWIEILGSRNEQKRLESHAPFGLPHRLVHETFG